MMTRDANEIKYLCVFILGEIFISSFEFYRNLIALFKGPTFYDLQFNTVSMIAIECQFTSHTV